MEPKSVKSLAFIFARGGSKGLPGKNIRPLAGKPLIVHSIDTARACCLIADVYVSTEDAEIAEVARQAGANIIERPAELATDTAPEWMAWRHAIEAAEQSQGPFDLFVSLPPTSPLRSVQDVENAIVAIEKDPAADICLTMTDAARSPYFNMVAADGTGGVKLAITGPAGFSRRQDAPKLFDITTVAYVAKPDYVKSQSSLFAGRVIGVSVPKARAVDIDDVWDFRFAESLIEGARNA